MQQQVLQDQKQVRLTEEEAALFVALHAEQEQKDGVTSLGDLAETLRVPPSEAERLLAEVRARLNPAPKAEPVAVKAIRPRKRFGRWLLLCMVVLAAIFTSFAVGLQSGRSARARWGWTTSSAPFPGVMSEILMGGDSSLAVAVRTGNLVTNVPASGAWSSNQETLLYTDAHERARLEDTIFEALDYASRSPTNASGFISVGVSNNDGNWKVFDVPIDGAFSEVMSNLKGRDAIREASLEQIPA